MKKRLRGLLCLLGLCFLTGCVKQNTDDETVTTEFQESSAIYQSEAPVETQEEAESVTEEDSVFCEKDGKQYERMQDLISGNYEWASAVTGGDMVKDENGHQNVDYNTQDRSFERVDGTEAISVRRWDNLLYSAGDYLVFEYNGIIHVSKYYDLYKPVLSYEAAGTYARVIKVPMGYMVGNDRSCKIMFYDHEFNSVKTIDGYRVAENGIYYQDGLMAVRDMESGLMGFMDQDGNLAIPCQYGSISDFSNGYASVLTNAEMTPYTEDAGTVSMYYGSGGNWGIIDTKGNYVLEPSEEYANKSMQDSTDENYYLFTRFTPVREDGTVDFVSLEDEERVITTVTIRP